MSGRGRRTDATLLFRWSLRSALVAVAVVGCVLGYVAKSGDTGPSRSGRSPRSTGSAGASARPMGIASSIPTERPVRAVMWDQRRGHRRRPRPAGLAAGPRNPLPQLPRVTEAGLERLRVLTGLGTWTSRRPGHRRRPGADPPAHPARVADPPRPDHRPGAGAAGLAEGSPGALALGVEGDRCRPDPPDAAGPSQAAGAPGAGITDAGLARLKELKNLRDLDLTGNPITDAGLPFVEAMPRLETVWIDRARRLGPMAERLRRDRPDLSDHPGVTGRRRWRRPPGHRAAEDVARGVNGRPSIRSQRLLLALGEDGHGLGGELLLGLVAPSRGGRCSRRGPGRAAAFWSSERARASATIGRVAIAAGPSQRRSIWASRSTLLGGQVGLEPGPLPLVDGRRRARRRRRSALEGGGLAVEVVDGPLDLGGLVGGRAGGRRGPRGGSAGAAGRPGPPRLVGQGPAAGQGRGRGHGRAIPSQSGTRANVAP